MYPDCLKELVGIGKVGCSEYDAEKDISTIGLFVVEDPAYNDCQFQSGGTSCDLTKILTEKREEVYRQITTDIGAVLSKKITTRSDSEYDIGGWGRGRYLGSFETPAIPSIQIKTEQREGASITINRVALDIAPLNNIPVTVNVRVIRESDNTLLKTCPITVTIVSNKLHKVSPISFPCDGDSYRVEYDYAPTFIVPETNYHCGCGDKLKQAAGFIYEAKQDNGKSVLTYGLHLPVTLSCDSGLKVCALLKNPDYRNVIGFMIRKKTIELTLKQIYFRQDVNKFTLLTSEDIGNQIAAYEAEYNSRLRYLEHQSDFDVDGFCLKCSGSAMRKFNHLTGRLG